MPETFCLTSHILLASWNRTEACENMQYVMSWLDAELLRSQPVEVYLKGRPQPEAQPRQKADDPAGHTLSWQSRFCTQAHVLLLP